VKGSEGRFECRPGRVEDGSRSEREFLRLQSVSIFITMNRKAYGLVLRTESQSALSCFRFRGTEPGEKGVFVIPQTVASSMSSMSIGGPRGNRLTPQYNAFSCQVLRSKLPLINAHATWQEIPSPAWAKTGRENDEHCGCESKTAARNPIGGMLCKWKEQKEIKKRDKRIEETGGHT
jgi:hypothetical protein